MVLGLLVVGWAVSKTNEQPDQIVVDAHEAIDFCAEALSLEVSSVLSYEDLRRLLRLHLEWIQAFHWASEGVAAADGPMIFEQFDAVDYILERADVNGFVVDRRHVAAVVDVHSSYLQVMGAIHIGNPEDTLVDLPELPLLGLPELGRRSDKSLSTGDFGVADFRDQEEGGGPTA
ncbi:MAG: hypothetical protein O3C27_13150 [Actinomycetota bacterium]|nr:hypothetical protein [Actinomycetota bacterium]